MTTMAHRAPVLQTLFTTTAEAVAARTGFVERRSTMTGTAFAHTLVFGWLANPHASLDAVAHTAAAVGVCVRPQGLDQRVHEGAAVFMEDLLAAALTTVGATTPVAVPILQRFTAVAILDSSTLVLPDVLAPYWPGCGGTTTHNTAAALKIGVRLDLCSGALAGPTLVDGRTHDAASPLQRAPLPAGALRLADLGFFDLDVFAQLQTHGVWWLSRLHDKTTVCDTQGRPLGVLALLAAQDAATLDLPIRLGAPHQLPARLLAVRVPEEVANERRHRLRVDAQRHGRTPSAARRAWCDGTLLVTNTPPALFSLHEALVLARARWQIEVLFQLWKSQGVIDASRSRTPWRILCEIFATVLAMLVPQWLLLCSAWAVPDRSLVTASHTVRQDAVALASALRSPLLLDHRLAVLAHCLGTGCRLNPRKKKPNTIPLLRDPSLLSLA